VQRSPRWTSSRTASSPRQRARRQCAYALVLPSNGWPSIRERPLGAALRWLRENCGLERAPTGYGGRDPARERNRRETPPSMPGRNEPLLEATRTRRPVRGRRRSGCAVACAPLSSTQDYLGISGGYRRGVRGGARGCLFRRLAVPCVCDSDLPGDGTLLIRPSSTSPVTGHKRIRALLRLGRASTRFLLPPARRGRSPSRCWWRTRVRWTSFYSTTCPSCMSPAARWLLTIGTLVVAVSLIERLPPRA